MEPLWSRAITQIRCTAIGSNKLTMFIEIVQFCSAWPTPRHFFVLIARFINFRHQAGLSEGFIDHLYLFTNPSLIKVGLSLLCRWIPPP